MVFSTFVKHTRAAHSNPKPQFFDCSYPKLRYSNNLANFEKFFRKATFGFNGPHRSATSDKGFFSIDQGHYGVYYTIYNHRSGEKKTTPINYKDLYDREAHIASINEDEQLTVAPWETFFISKVSRETIDNVQSLRKKSQRLLSNRQTKSNHSHNISQRYYSTKSAAQEELTQNDKYETSKPDVSEANETFEEKLLRVQTAQINENFASKSNLDVIYPLYQSLKRNDIKLPSIDLYNKVLESFVLRNCDNTELDLIQIETRLSNLLTVYSDLLTSGLKPDTTTYKVVLNTLFQGSRQCIQIFASASNTENLTNAAYMKCQEFLKIAIDLFKCVNISKDPITIEPILINLCLSLNVFPEQANKELAQSILTLVKQVSKSSSNPELFITALGFSKFLTTHNLVEDHKIAYDFISEIFENFKTQSNETPTFIDQEYTIYSCLVQSLILNKNFGVATKFVDNIMLEYRNSIERGTDNMIDKANISLLMSTYIKTLMSNTEKDELIKSYELVQKFNESAYVPELSVDLYNDMITRFVLKLSLLQQQSLATNDQTLSSHKEQETIYNIIWGLYSYVAIRKDYHEIPQSNVSSIVLSHIFTGRARDFLLSFSIDKADHEKIFMLIKEIILKNHLIKDFTVYRKMISYLYNGAFYGGNINIKYFDLMWSLLECQFTCYKSDSASMHFFLSGVAQFLQIGNFDSQSVAHCVKTLVESKMIKECFENFNLQTSNIYGLMCISKELIKNSGLIQDKQILTRLTQMQAQLINELEDTENHYLELSEDIKLFKCALKENYENLINQRRNFDGELSEEMISACRLCNMNFDTQAVIINNASVEKLGYQLRVNYNLGVEQFITSFNEGSVFDEDTWNLIINSNFVNEVLESNYEIKVNDFIARILDSNIESDIQIISNLIAFKNDKINIEILKFFISHKVINSDKIYNNLLLAFTESSNKYLQYLVMKYINLIIDNTEDKKLSISLYFKGLVTHKKFEPILEFINLKPDFIGSLNNKLEVDISIMESVLESYLETNQCKKFNFIFAKFFSKKTTSSPKMKELLIKNATINGMHDIVMQKFAKSKHNLQSTQDLINFNAFMKSLNDTKFILDASSDDSTINYNTCKLLSQRNLSDMIDTYKNKLQFYRHFQNDIISESLTTFVNAAKINEQLGKIESCNALKTRFQTFLSFLKFVNFNQLSTDDLTKIIKFYSILKKYDLINVLLNKVSYISDSGQYNVSPMLDYYFFEVSLYTSTKNQLLSVLREFYNAFKKSNDSVNMSIINDLCNHYKLKLNDREIMTI